MTFLKAHERVLLAQSLDRADDLAVLSITDLEKIIQRSFPRKTWQSADLLAAAERDRVESERRGISFVSYTSDDYPPLLRELPDPPTVLFYRGTLPDPEKPLAGVVGTRHPSSEGSRIAYEIGRDFGKSGVAVVSGLALGIDSLAHRGNADAAAPTVAVLGCGLDSVYPASNRALARRIVECGGALLSEYPCGTLPLKHHFPARNRIIAGLSRALVVVEAPDHSGALISADFALDQGRDLWVVSGCLATHAAEGCRKLVADGARVARNAFDIVADWGLRVPSVAVPALSICPANALSFGTRAAKLLELELQTNTTVKPTPLGVR